MVEIAVVCGKDVEAATTRHRIRTQSPAIPVYTGDNELVNHAPRNAFVRNHVERNRSRVTSCDRLRRSALKIKATQSNSPDRPLKPFPAPDFSSRAKHEIRALSLR
jgi:hypothetical protein